MNSFKNNKFKYLAFIGSIIIILSSQIGCQKTGSLPKESGIASLTFINAIPNSGILIPTINTSQAIVWFNSSLPLGTNYGGFYYNTGNGGNEYTPLAGNDTVYVVQYGHDTLYIGPKAKGQMFYGVLPLEQGGIYSLYLCGTDTTSPDYIFNIDSLPIHNPSDSVMGIRFVNLSTGSNPISINLEGSPNGSEVQNLSYKGLTAFKQYSNNSSTHDYLFVIRDAATGDSLTQFEFNPYGNFYNGYGITDPVNGGQLLTSKNVTIALIGQPGVAALVPQSTMLIDNY